MMRVLKQNGVLRISVPDFDRILDMYRGTNNSIDSITQPLMGGQDYEYNFHHSVFNKTYLSELLMESGFKSVKEWNPNNCLYHDFDDWASKTIDYDSRNYIISLNIEGQKID
jgi:predicted SAM-dependent methyltransferase